MLVNHVISNDTHSAIFTMIFDYFVEYAPSGARIEVTVEPLPEADIHHYHRPHLARNLSNRAVATVHHDLLDADPWLELDRFLPRYREARRVICLNHGQQRFLARHGIGQTAVIPHGYNDRVLRPKARRPRDVREDGKIAIGIISKYYDRRVKGEAYLHDLLKRLSPRHFTFVLVGERRLVTAESMAELGYEVRCFEFLPYRLFQSLYESVDYLLVCSNAEGGPANLPEAVATCTPLLATPVGAVPDFIDDGAGGLILSGDPDADAGRIRRLVDPADPLTTALEQGIRGVRARMPTWRDVVENHFQVYRTLSL